MRTLAKAGWILHSNHKGDAAHIYYESSLVPELDALWKAATGHIVGEGPFQPAHEQVLGVWGGGNCSVQPAWPYLRLLACRHLPSDKLHWHKFEPSEADYISNSEACSMKQLDL